MKNLRILSSIIIVTVLILGCSYKPNNKIKIAQGKNIAGNHIPFSDATIIIEVNSTDGDSGIQIFLDGDGWDLVDINGPGWDYDCRCNG